MAFTESALVLWTSVDPRRWRLFLVVFLVRMWRLNACERLTLPRTLSSLNSVTDCSRRAKYFFIARRAQQSARLHPLHAALQAHAHLIGGRGRQCRSRFRRWIA